MDLKQAMSYPPGTRICRRSRRGRVFHIADSVTEPLLLAFGGDGDHDLARGQKLYVDTLTIDDAIADDWDVAPKVVEVDADEIIDLLATKYGVARDLIKLDPRTVARVTIVED